MPIREAREDDLDEIVALIRELAEYERSPEQAKATTTDLRVALFSDHPKVFCRIAETDSGETAGFALYFYNFSTWEGRHGLYLEDLFIRPRFRGQGLGGALLRHLATIAVENGFARMEWVVLNWNAPAIAVYDRIGGVPLDDWTTYRLTGDALAEFAGAAADPRRP
ncbi:GNAT family N-acetyltransferase [Microlunatus sp. Gsoil 973]|uniref:GNAT family N-acetyltransferase n=1 Tax=Microlunatus sp. Gsoil 973 TaxID=2672569 RepID=UPI0012B4DC90|nr:GNAT family N-acetyltransferase [Microlunatus sp. Gsoil 973]QGN35022.1 GNAT family N-acetyltransferase [Microlunatus sp. Gsoil 973]